MLEAPLLSVRGLNAWYSESHILHGAEFEVPRGEVVTLLGRNGVGKTTTLKAVVGMVSRRKGSVRFDGAETIALRSDRIARLGVAFCPEERGIFASLNVHENLLLPPAFRSGGLAGEWGFALLPNLTERLASRVAPAASGRADRRSRSGDRSADRTYHLAAQGGRVYHPPGRAEFPVRV